MTVSRIFPLMLMACVAACAQPDHKPVDPAAIENAGIANLRSPLPGAYASGQPTKEQFSVLAAAGVRHIVNLRPAGEQDWNERAWVESLGMQYHLIPVAGSNDVTQQNAQALARVLDTAGDEPVLVHCKSGNRVGALAALVAFDRSHDLEASITEGRNWGLTRLEPVVRKRLTEPSPGAR